MNAAVIYESSFGNTRALAASIAESLGAKLYSVDEAPPSFDGLDLLVVGAPTQLKGLSTETSRTAARDAGARAPVSIGMRGWLDRMPKTRGLAAAAFDTRMPRPVSSSGSAARGIAKKLRRRGCSLAAPPESFFVSNPVGPLSSLELARAAEWARTLRSEPQRVDRIGRVWRPRSTSARSSTSTARS